MANLKDKLINAKEDLKVWSYNHKDEIYRIMYGVVGVASVTLPVIFKFMRQERRYHPDDRRIWDPSLGWYWETKKLSNNKKLLIEERRRNGESLGEILRDLKVLR